MDPIEANELIAFSFICDDPFYILLYTASKINGKWGAIFPSSIKSSKKFVKHANQWEAHLSTESFNPSVIMGNKSSKYFS